jgi:hypothetical protein
LSSADAREERRRIARKKMLDVTRTRDKKTAYFVFTLELMLSLTPATYQLGARDVGNEKMSATKT